MKKAELRPRDEREKEEKEAWQQLAASVSHVYYIKRGDREKGKRKEIQPLK